ncbi:MAG: type II toxin-antitoxin system VapC family toxin [Blastochloris sp.]|nr:type II toxin-antitoxin system VapC family toxin [Blastochloris sp.]
MDTLGANIFARDADPADPLHTVCRNLLEVLDQQQRPIIVPNLVLAEVAATISRTRRDPIRGRLTAQAITMLEHVQLIPLDDALAQAAAELAPTAALRGADAVYVAVARQHGCTLVSLDREQRERAAAVVRVLTPDAALAELEGGARYVRTTGYSNRSGCNARARNSTPSTFWMPGLVYS